MHGPQSSQQTGLTKVIYGSTPMSNSWKAEFGEISVQLIDSTCIFLFCRDTRMEIFMLLIIF